MTLTRVTEEVDKVDVLTCAENEEETEKEVVRAKETVLAVEVVEE